MSTRGWFVSLAVFSAVLPVCSQPLLVPDLPDRVPVSVRSWAGKHELHRTSITPDRQLIALVLGDAESISRFDEIRTSIVTLYSAVNKTRAFRLAVWTAQGMQFAGPFKTRVQLQSAMKELSELAVSSPLTLNPMQFWSQLPSAASQAGTGWLSVIIIGRLPLLEGPAGDYAAAYVSDKARRQRIRLSFWQPGEEPGAFVRSITTASCGAGVDSLSTFAEMLGAEPDAYLELAADPPAVGRGFHVYRQTFLNGGGGAVMEASAISSAPKFNLPDIERYAAMIEAVATAEKLTATGDFDSAGEAIDKALAVNPHDNAALRIAAGIYEKKGNHAAAADALSALVETNGADGALLAETGHEFFLAGNPDAAEPLLVRAKEAGTSTAAVNEELARIHAERNDFSGAFPFLDESLRLNPKNQSLWFERADAASATGSLIEVAKSLEKGLELGGDHLDRRTSLVRLYIERQQRDDALRHIHFVTGSLPKDLETRTTYAGFLDSLDRKDEALETWRAALEIDSRCEPAHFRVARLLIDAGKYPDALKASEAGLAAGPSARLYLARADAQDRTNDVYGLRRTLREGVAAFSGDLDLLRRRAEVEDAVGWDGPSAIEALSNALAKAGAPAGERGPVLERGVEVSLREADQERASKLAGELSELGRGKATRRAAETNAGVRGSAIVPGGVAALIFIAKGKEPSSADDTLIEHCRSVAAESMSNAKEFAGYQTAVKEHFERIAALAPFGTRKADTVILHLSVSDKKSRQSSEKALSLLGWKMHSGKSGVTLETAAKGAQARRHDTASALAFDELGMKEDLEAGKTFDIEIPYEKVPVFPDENSWKTTFYPSEPMPGGLAEAVVHDPRLARLYIGLNSMSTPTANALISTFGLKTLAEKHASLLERYASALAIANGHVAVPGGGSAEAIWSQLVGTSPADPKQFFRALIERDHGRAIAYYATLAQLDAAHQKFFTRTASRTKRFYELFSTEMEAGPGVEKLQRDSSFLSFLQDIPLLDDGGVDFPGSPEVWMVAKGQSGTTARTAKLIRKLKKAAAPDVEDDILIHLANTRYKTHGIHRSELENFLAVTRIDAHRLEPLDDASALMLAQHYVSHQSFYPYFSIYTGLGKREFARFFEMRERLKMPDPVDTNLTLGSIHSLLALGSLALERGALDQKVATEFFYQLADRFASVTTPAGSAAGSLALAQALVAAGTEERERDPDDSIRAALLGATGAATFAWSGKVIAFDASQQRHDEFQQVLAAQRIPTLKSLFRIQSAALAIAAQKSAPENLKILEAEIAALPQVEVPKTLKPDGKQKDLLLSFRSDKLPGMVAQFRQRLSKKKVNPKDLDKIAHDLIGELGPSTTIALTGLVYAYYLRPSDLVVSDDPLLVRKHSYVDLTSAPRSGEFTNAQFRKTQEKMGSHFMGGLGDFAIAAGGAASVGVLAAGASEMTVAAQMAALRATQWQELRDDDLLLAAARIRVAREWITKAASDANLSEALADETMGLLSLKRRIELLNALSAGDWRTVWNAVTLGDLFALSDRYLARYPQDPWQSPSVTALRNIAKRNDGSRLHWLGPVLPDVFDCSHPHLMVLAPYEDYERYLIPDKLAERSAELKLYLAALADREGLPAASLGYFAEPVAANTLRGLKMTDIRDWRSEILAFASLDSKALEVASEK